MRDAPLPEYEGWQPSAPSASSARLLQANVDKDLTTRDLRTVACDADGRGKDVGPTVRANSNQSIGQPSQPVSRRSRGRRPCFSPWQGVHKLWITAMNGRRRNAEGARGFLDGEQFAVDHVSLRLKAWDLPVLRRRARSTGRQDIAGSATSSVRNTAASSGAAAQWTPLREASPRT
jgi:hypothetical protein